MLSAFFLIPLPHLPSNQIQLLCASAFTKSFFVSLHRCIFNGASGKRLCCVRRAALQLEPCRTGAKTAREVGQSERTPWILSRTAAVTSCACVMCSNRRFPALVSFLSFPCGFADRFCCHTHRGAVSSSTRSRDQRRDAASLSKEGGEKLFERLCGTLSLISPPLHCSFSAKDSRRMWGLSVQCT